MKMWNVTYSESFSGKEIDVKVRASGQQEAIIKATDRLNMDFPSRKARISSSAARRPIAFRLTKS